MAIPTTFSPYLRAWWKAAFAPAWDAFGWLGVAVGAILWAWHRFWPRSFDVVARYCGLTPNAAMSDLVWILPLMLGVAVLLYRLVRAPFEMHIASEKHAQKQMAELRAEVGALRTRTHAFDIDVQLNGVYLVKKPDTNEWPVFYVVIPGVVLTNRGDEQIPVEPWFTILVADGWHEGRAAMNAQPPESVIDEMKLGGEEHLKRVVNLRPRKSESGYWVFECDYSILHWIGATDEELAKLLKRPLWLDLKNLVSGESRYRTLNPEANQLLLFDHPERFKSGVIS
jgi:hypothetical protein